MIRLILLTVPGFLFFVASCLVLWLLISLPEASAKNREEKSREVIIFVLIAIGKKSATILFAAICHRYVWWVSLPLSLSAVAATFLLSCKRK